MRSAHQIKEHIGELRDELDAIIAVSEREKRDLNEEETSRVTEITDSLIPHLNKQLRTAVAVDKERMQRASKRLGEELEAQMADSGKEVGSVAGGPYSRAFAIPARARIHGALKAYTGPDAERNAYVAGQAILAGIYGNESAAQFCRAHGLAVQGNMLGDTNSAGGFLVPDEMQAALIRMREERGVFPQYANRIPMGTDNMTVPRLLADVTAYWSGEGVEITASDATLGSLELSAKKLAALTKVSTELDEDAVIEIGDMITQSMAYAMADKIDDAAFNGDGTSTYGGVLGLKNAIHANATQDAVAGNDSALTLDLADFEATVGKYPAYPAAAPRWFMHSAVYWASAARLVDAAGGNTTITLAGGPSTQMFLGYPVQFVQVMPSTTGTLASTIIAYFGDIRLGATYGTRRSMRTQVTLDRYFENDLIGIKATERVAIAIHERGDTIRNRPIIALKTAA